MEKGESRLLLLILLLLLLAPSPRLRGRSRFGGNEPVTLSNLSPCCRLDPPAYRLSSRRIG